MTQNEERRSPLYNICYLKIILLLQLVLVEIPLAHFETEQYIFYGMVILAIILITIYAYRRTGFWLRQSLPDALEWISAYPCISL